MERRVIDSRNAWTRDCSYVSYAYRIATLQLLHLLLLLLLLLLMVLRLTPAFGTFISSATNNDRDERLKTIIR